MLVLQATPFCNLDCSYCYLPDRASTQRMSEATLARAFQRVFESPFLSNQLTVLWHAGEPLVPGVEYYRRAFQIAEAAKPDDLDLKHHFQTNGTLIDRTWADFFKSRQDISIGVSLDGPATLHDRRRKTRRGGGSFSRVMRGIRVLQENGIPFHVITVLTRDALGSAGELYAFYVEHGIDQVGFNIDEVEGINASSSLSGCDADAEMRAFLREFLTLADSGPPLAVREVLGATAGIVNRSAADYGNPMAQALRALSIGVNGAISTFSPELLGYGHERHGEYVFGNVHDGPLADMLDDTRFLAVDAEIREGLRLCAATCGYFEICRGGAPANKLFENGSFATTETLFCRLTKQAVIDVVLERLEDRLELAA